MCLVKGVGSQPGHGSPKAKALLKAQEYGFREREARLVLREIGE